MIIGFSTNLVFDQIDRIKAKKIIKNCHGVYTME